MRKQINTVIVGAGTGGKILLNEFSNPQYGRFNLIGFVDDDETKIGTKIETVKVLGSTFDIPKITEDYSIELYIIAIPSASGKIVQRIVDIIHKTKSEYMIVPTLFRNLVIDQISYPRKVNINDILRRPIENVLTEDSMNKLNDSIVLITGVAGSIGSEICNQIASCNPKKIIGIDVAETPLFHTTNKIKKEFPKIDFVPKLCNIQDKDKLVEIFNETKPEIVYHCAAYKHVGLMQLFPHECVKNNVLGSLNVINQTLESGVDRFVFVSTDKAVNPNSIMGASKRIIEKYLLNLERNSTKLMIVRFGNVLESNGSAITIFKDQINKGGPITITDMKMERFFMTIIEAAQLVIQASILGTGGELFVLDMGEPYKIIDIVKRMIELSGFSIENIPIKVIGRRPGEKLTEELFYSYEKPESSMHKHIFNCNFSLMNKVDDYNDRISDLTLSHVEMENSKLKELILKLAE